MPARVRDERYGTREAVESYLSHDRARDDAPRPALCMPARPARVRPRVPVLGPCPFPSPPFPAPARRHPAAPPRLVSPSPLSPAAQTPPPPPLAPSPAPRGSSHAAAAAAAAAGAGGGAAHPRDAAPLRVAAVDAAQRLLRRVPQEPGHDHLPDPRVDVARHLPRPPDRVSGR